MPDQGKFHPALRACSCGDRCTCRHLSPTHPARPVQDARKGMPLCCPLWNRLLDTYRNTITSEKTASQSNTSQYGKRVRTIQLTKSAFNMLSDKSIRLSVSMRICSVSNANSNWASCSRGSDGNVLSTPFGSLPASIDPEAFPVIFSGLAPHFHRNVRLSFTGTFIEGSQGGEVCAELTWWRPMRGSGGAQLDRVMAV